MADIYKKVEEAVSSVGKEIEKGVNKIGKNIEKNAGDILTETAYAVSTGDFSNFDQTLLKAGAFGAGAGVLNPATLQYKETNIQRATREAQEAAAVAEIEASAAKERERLSGLANMLTASANARRLAPGMSQTLLGSGGANNPLITVK